MPATVWIQLHRHGEWHTAAQVEPRTPELGYQGACHLEYTPDYLVQHLADIDHPGLGLSVRYPPSWMLYREGRWPAFLLDLLPSGAGRRHHLGRLRLPNGPAADWPLLQYGARNPVGNLRVVRERDSDPERSPAHPGFPRTAVLERQDTFLEYAQEEGASVGGSTDVQGDAPKFLLTQTVDGHFHPDGVLEDARAAVHWLVKFPRGKSADDQLVLRNEAAYLRVAKAIGLHAPIVPDFERNTLFMRRFDRISKRGQVTRLGLESLCSMAGVSDYGAFFDQEDLCETLWRHCNVDSGGAVLEYVQRDVLNIALGNKDNHARNTAVLKQTDGRIMLAPLYDFAPMYRDPAGVVRTCTWRTAERGGFVDWSTVSAVVGNMIKDPTRAADCLRSFADTVKHLPETMTECGVDSEIIDQRRAAIQEVHDSLVRIKGSATDKVSKP